MFRQKPKRTRNSALSRDYRYRARTRRCWKKLPVAGPGQYKWRRRIRDYVRTRKRPTVTETASLLFERLLFFVHENRDRGDVSRAPGNRRFHSGYRANDYYFVVRRDRCVERKRRHTGGDSSELRFPMWHEHVRSAPSPRLSSRGNGGVCVCVGGNYDASSEFATVAR